MALGRAEDDHEHKNSTNHQMNNHTPIDTSILRISLIEHPSNTKALAARQKYDKKKVFVQQFLQKKDDDDFSGDNNDIDEDNDDNNEDDEDNDDNLEATLRHRISLGLHYDDTNNNT